jgi:hypothetical protein
LADSIKQNYSVECYPIAMDLAKENAAQELFEKTTSLNLDVDDLVNNAGFGAIGDFEDYDLKRYQSMLQLNIKTLTERCSLYLPSIKKSNSGGIINVASTAAFFTSSIFSSVRRY